MPKQWWPRGDLSYLIDAKGDLLVGAENDTAVRLGVGINGQALVADSTQASGLKWDSIHAVGTGGSIIVDIPVPQSVWVIDVGQLADIMVIDSAGTVTRNCGR